MTSKALRAPKPLVANADPETVTTLKELIQAVAKPKRPWDMIVFTDGSGSKIGTPSGHAALIINRRAARPVLISGRSSYGSSQQAELQAVHAMCQYLEQSKLMRRSNGLNVYLITDSSYVARLLMTLAKDPVALLKPKKHAIQLAGIQFVSRWGVRIYPTHIHRNWFLPMELVDRVSRCERKQQPLDHTQIIDEFVEASKHTFKLE